MGGEKGEDPSGRGMARRGLRWESVASRSGSEWRVRVCWRRLLADGCRVYVVRGPEEESLLSSVGGTTQCRVTAWPGDDSMKGEVVGQVPRPGE